MHKNILLTKLVLVVTLAVATQTIAAERHRPSAGGKIGTMLKIPKPRLKPANLLVAPTVTAGKASPLFFPAIGNGSSWPKNTIEFERKRCAIKLKAMDITFETMAPFGQANGCGASAAVKVAAVSGVAIVPPAEMTCDLAEAVHAWINSSVVPNARNLLKKRLIKINNASAYVCRRRNNAASGKLSEHAMANAWDISTLSFDDGLSINIKGDWSGLKQTTGVPSKGAFLKRIRKDACIRFTTVLGPGSDPFHGDHFHIDVSRRKNGYRICS